jgi:hypothetical protein
MTRFLIIGFASCLGLASALAVSTTHDKAPAAAVAPSTTNTVAAAPLPATNAAASTAAKPEDAEDKHGLRIVVGDDDGDDAGATTTHHHHEDSAFEANVIPIVAIVSIFGMPVLIVFLIVYFRFRRRQETLATVREYLSKGLPVPPELLSGGSSFDEAIRSDPAAPGAGRCDARRGIILLFIGAGLSLALYFGNPREHDWAWALIPLVIGLGYLVTGLFEMSLERKNHPSHPPLPPVPPS